MKLQPLHKPLLCEKPITKNLGQLRLIQEAFRKSPFKMVCQYKGLNGEGGSSFYNYYNTGKDGLYWDCIQIIGLAKGHVEVFNDSPIWSCRLNGRQLTISVMDLAYIDMVKEWLNDPFGSISEFVEMHLKTHEMELNAQRDKTN